MASSPSGSSPASSAGWLTVPVLTLSADARNVPTSAGERRKCSTQTPCSPAACRPGGERVEAVVGDDDQACPEAQVGGELACGREEAEDLAACPRGVVGESVADRSGGAPRERGVGVGLDLELERRVWWRELEQLVEQKRTLLAWSAVALTQPPRPDLRRGALMRPARERGAELEQRVVEQHQLAVRGQAAVCLEPVDALLE